MALITAALGRKAEHAVLPQVLNRWSPRSFLPVPIPKDTLLTVLEAGKWAPSSYNTQPWRFLYAQRDSAIWPTFLSLLVEQNQAWAKNTSALVFVITQSAAADGTKFAVHTYDTGAAWGFASLQATALGWETHGMSGLDYGKAKEVLKLPPNFDVAASFAIGKLGPKENLPEGYQQYENPGQRKPLAQVAQEGLFTDNLL